MIGVKSTPRVSGGGVTPSNEHRVGTTSIKEANSLELPPLKSFGFEITKGTLRASS